MNIVSNAVNYLNDVRLEMSRVTWPTRSQTVRMTALVIVLSLVIGAFLGGLDFVLTKILALLVSR
ncbi:MAG: preprotein translocase subunit SecE [Candidatus Woykebacteria bacterium]